MEAFAAIMPDSVELYNDKASADDCADGYGGRVVRLVPETDYRLGQKVYYTAEAIKEQSPECWRGMLDARPVIVGMTFRSYDPEATVIDYALDDDGEVTDGYLEKHFSVHPASEHQLT